MRTCEFWTGSSPCAQIPCAITTLPKCWTSICSGCPPPVRFVATYRNGIFCAGVNDRLQQVVKLIHVQLSLLQDFLHLLLNSQSNCRGDLFLNEKNQGKASEYSSQSSPGSKASSLKLSCSTLQVCGGRNAFRLQPAWSDSTLLFLLTKDTWYQIDSHQAIPTNGRFRGSTVMVESKQHLLQTLQSNMCWRIKKTTASPS